MSNAPPRIGRSYASRRTDLPGRNLQTDKTGQARAAFERNRCPLHAAQIADARKTEFQRREDASGGSRMIRKEKPKSVHKPGPALAHGADRAAFNARWNAERKAARNRNH